MRCAPGFSLDPLLFCIFIDGRPLYITNNNVFCDLFTDNSCIYACGADLQSVQSFLQECLDDVLKWCNQHRMVIHPQKPQSMVLAQGQKRQFKPLTLNATLGKNPVEQVGEHRVLSVVIDDELKWQPDLDSICKHLSRNLFLLNQLKHDVDSDARKIFFQAHLLSHINYASAFWNGASEVHLKKKKKKVQPSS